MTTVQIHLPDDHAAALRMKAAAHGLTLEAWLQKLADEAPPGDDDTDLGEGPEPPRSLSARIRGIWADMPGDVRAEYPEGGAHQIDHHVYGLPKRDE
jgi:hypothetical protein